MFYGLLNLSFWGYVAAILLLSHVTVTAVTLFLHRCQAHRSLELHPILSHFFRLWLWLTTGMNTKAWTAIHRKHHAKCEREGDPHSPQLLGLKKVLFEGAELYRLEAANAETVERYGHGTPDDWLERHLYTPHPYLGVGILFVMYLILFGIPGITVWALHMAWIPFFAAGIINGVGHYFGYRNFECPDASVNIVPWGIVSGGEELHNNHHTYPTSAKLSVKWWEFDIGWLYIRVFGLLGLARPKKVPPKLHYQPGKLTIDADTVKACITNRFQIMARYAKDVIAPVWQEEKRKARGKARSFLRQARKWLVRDKSLVDPQTKENLMVLLKERETLAVVYQYRLKLQAVWERNSATQKDLIDALQEWCRQAENAGIDALRRFAEQLRMYVPAISATAEIAS